MTKAELLRTLADCAANDDTEVAHIDADNALLDFLNDPEIRAAFENVPRWYA